tara:strand:+ start:200 stop:433 length:234 start_codon:yes stop_codon:yes gene_type:complete
MYKNELMFGTGIAIVLLVIVLLSINDKSTGLNYNNEADKLVRIFKKCQGVGSTPATFTKLTVTCSNGVEISYSLIRE